MKLNIDIFLIILSFAEPKAICPLTETCRFLRHEGAKALLRRGVTLRTAQQVRSFVSFVEAEEGTERRQLLRCLKLYPHYNEVAAFGEMGDVLSALFLSLHDTLPGLQELAISVPFDRLLSHPGMVGSIAGITTLRNLRIEGAGERAIQFLQNIQFALELAYLEFSFDVHETTRDLDIAKLLPASQHTLKSLTVVDFSGKIFADGLVLNNLTTLDIRGIDARITTHLVHLCPNLTSLYISRGDYFDLGVDTQDYETYRAMNKKQQQLHGSWRSLECLMCPFYHLYLLGLTCHVRSYVDLDFFADDHYDAYFRTILSDIRPKEVSVSEMHGCHRLLAGSFVEALCEAREPQIESLSLNIIISCLDLDLDVAFFLNAIIRIAQILRLTSLDVSVQKYFVPDPYDCPHSLKKCPAERATRTAAFKAALNATDIEATIRRFRSAVPTLENVTLSLHIAK